MESAKQRASDLLQNVQNLKVNELKKELTDRGVALPGKALKVDLVAKLKEVLEQEMEVLNSDAGSGKVDDEPDLLTTLEELSQEPENDTATPAVNTSSATVESMASITVAKPPVATALGANGVIAGGDLSLVDVTQVKKIASSPTKDTEDAKKARAARFGITVAETTTKADGGSKLEALKKRSERFGVVSDTLKKVEDTEKLAERKKRFGEAIPVTDEKLAARQARFGVVSADAPAAVKGIVDKSNMKVKRKEVTPEEDEKIKKRKARFGLVA